MKKPIVSQTEHQIQSTILQILPYYGVFAWRNNSGMIAVGEGKYRRMIKIGTAGLPDIIGIQKESGKLVGLEVKKPSKKPTELQKHMLATLEKYGAIVAVVHSLEEVKKLFWKRRQYEKENKKTM
jgi:hypothetical protein